MRYEHLKNAQDKMKKYADMKRRQVKFLVGDLVFLKIRPYRQTSLRKKRNEKLSPKYFRPYKVLKRMGLVAYKLELLATSSIHLVFHISQLKKMIGEHTKVLQLLPNMNENHEGMTRPEEVYGYRKNPSTKEWEVLIRAVIEAFVRLHERGLIYQGSYMVNWSPNLQTAVSDLEVEYSEESGTLYHIKYRVAGGSSSDYLTVATTRPETLFGDVAIAVNPQDDRYSKYVGMTAIVPMTYGRHVPIISDKNVDKDFGTGVLKISPGHDHNDYLLARKLGLPILNVMNKDGTLNKVAGLYCGLDRFEARKKLWTDLEEMGLAVKKEAHTLRVPRSQRGGEIIEPLVSKQWFVTMEPLAEKALRAVEKGELTIIPERFEKIYNHWLSNIKDWCISRQLWWGHRIPVWYIVGKNPEEDYIVARNADEALEQAQKKYGKDVEIYQDPDVLDTWFSSALWPFSTLGWPDETAEDFKRFYPTTMLETGHDILFFWVARMVMMGIEFTGTVPFSYIYLHGLIRDSQGRKMSKTLGNVIDPLDTIKEFGTDALRFTLALGTAGQDLNLSTERLTSNKAFTNKLWNAGKFILQNLPTQNDSQSWDAILSFEFEKDDCLLKLPLPECWIVSELHSLIDVVTISYDKFFFGDVGRDVYNFFWGDFADWYIEASKARLYQSGGDSVALAQAVLLYVFKNILKLLHPFMPFVTEELWQALPNRKEALIISHWPQISLPRQASAVKKFENLKLLTKAIRNARAEYSVEPAKRISASIVASEEVNQYISPAATAVAASRVVAAGHCTPTTAAAGPRQKLFFLDVFELNSNWKIYAKEEIVEDSRIYKFLAGINVEFDEVRGRTLGKTTFPSINNVFEEVRREESCMNVMGGKKPIDFVESSALVTEQKAMGSSNHSNKIREKPETAKDYFI
ncbi:valine--tRNA ligase [Cucumis melo var. makuwa]|uniref:valine--tRNA ligase n=1 Tax=Cucumis melo var. makuwa TaxID=1194695 RepID=A0A5D3E2L8_CUCMM|nr:valine--tRNA ligase [Cucumis melo var. makuwa]